MPVTLFLHGLLQRLFAGELAWVEILELQLQFVQAVTAIIAGVRFASVTFGR